MNDGGSILDSQYWHDSDCPYFDAEIDKDCPVCGYEFWEYAE